MNRSVVALSAALGAVVLCLSFTTTSAAGAEAKVGLGTAKPFAVLAGSAVTNTGPSVINGDLGLSPGTSVTGFPPGLVSGAQHVTDAVALQAQDDLTTAYNDAAGRTPAIVKTGQDLGGQTLVGGVYRASSTMPLTGTLTLDAQGNNQTVFIFQAGSSLITATSSKVRLINGAQACNVFWQVGSSATLGTSTRFVGTIMALSSVTLQTDARIEGRVLARNGAVTLDTNVITRPGCATGPTNPTTSPTTSPSTTEPSWPAYSPTGSETPGTTNPSGPSDSPNTPSETTSTTPPGGGSGDGGGPIPFGHPGTGIAPTTGVDLASSLRAPLWAAATLLSVALVATVFSRRRSSWLARQR